MTAIRSTFQDAVVPGFLRGTENLDDDRSQAPAVKVIQDFTRSLTGVQGSVNHPGMIQIMADSVAESAFPGTVSARHENDIFLRTNSVKQHGPDQPNGQLASQQMKSFHGICL